MVDRKKAPPIRDFEKLSLPRCEKIILPNGITLHLIRTGSVPANRFSVVWNYGGDKCKGEYSAKLVPEMMLQGTKSMSAEEIVDNLDFYGTFLTTSVTRSYSKIEWTCLNEFALNVLTIIHDIIMLPVFPEARLEAVKRKELMKFDLTLTQTKSVASRELNRLIAGNNHPYIRKTERQDIENVTVESIKEAWREGIFHTDIHIFVAGYITDELRKNIIDFGSKLRTQTTNAPSLEPAPLKAEKAGRYFIEMPDSRQTSLAIAIPTIKRDNPDYIPLRIAVTALGGYFGSRLMTSIREQKGLTYGIHSYLAATQEGGFITIAAECDAKKIEDVISAINEEIRLLASQPMDNEELARLKSYYRTVIASTLESFKSVGDYFESELTVGFTKDYFDEQQNVLESMTTSDIACMARKYLDIDSQRIVIVGKAM